MNSINIYVPQPILELIIGFVMDCNPTKKDKKSIPLVCWNWLLIIRRIIRPIQTILYFVKTFNTKSAIELLKDGKIPPRGFIEILMKTCRKGNLEFLRELLKDKSICFHILGRNDPLQAACRGNNMDVVKELLKSPRLDSVIRNSSVLSSVCRSGNLELVKLLLSDERIDPSERGYNCSIKAAAEWFHLDVVKELIKDPRVDPSAGNNECIINASIIGDLELVKILLKDKRVNPTVSSNGPIRYASKCGHVHVVKELLKHPMVDPFHIYYNEFGTGRDAISFAYNNRHEDVLIILLAQLLINMFGYGKIYLCM